MNSRARGPLARPNEFNAATRPKARNPRSNPWRAYAGIWRESPEFEAFRKEIDVIRREASEAEEKT